MKGEGFVNHYQVHAHLQKPVKFRDHKDKAGQNVYHGELFKGRNYETVIRYSM